MGLLKVLITDVLDIVEGSDSLTFLLKLKSGTTMNLMAAQRYLLLYSSD